MNSQKRANKESTWLFSYIINAKYIIQFSKYLIFHKRYRDFKMIAVEEKSSIQPQDSNNFSLFKVIVLVFVPTILLTTVYVILGFSQTKIPSILLFYVLALLILFPIELAVIFRASKKEFGSYSLRSALVNQKKAGWKRTLFIALLLFGFAGIMSITLAPLEKSLVAPLVNKLAAITPAHFDWTWTNFESFRQYPRQILLLMSIVYLILNVVVGPIVEELYFRGYLTSKLSRFGVGAPIIITILFSLYHLWLPFLNLFRIAVFFPAAYFAWKEKNIFISMAFHCISNLFSTVSFLVALYSTY